MHRSLYLLLVLKNRLDTPLLQGGQNYDIPGRQQEGKVLPAPQVHELPWADLVRSMAFNNKNNNLHG